MTIRDIFEPIEDAWARCGVVVVSSNMLCCCTRRWVLKHGPTDQLFQASFNPTMPDEELVKAGLILLREGREAGLTITLDDDDVSLNIKGPKSAEPIVAQIRQCEIAVIAALEDWSPDAIVERLEAQMRDYVVALEK